jgi:hypothetical protein
LRRRAAEQAEGGFAHADGGEFQIFLHQAGGGSLLIGEEDGAPAQFPAQGGGEVGLMDGGKAIQQQGAFARAQRLAGGRESG